MLKAVFVKHKLTYKEREVDNSKVQKVQDWLSCMTVTKVKGFLRTARVIRVFIRDYTKIARVLNCLTKKGVEFI